MIQETEAKFANSTLVSVKSYIAASPLNQKQLLLTTGDNNMQDDIGLYQGLKWLEKKHIIGKVSGFLPYIGYVTIAMVRFLGPHLETSNRNLTASFPPL